MGLLINGPTWRPESENDKEDGYCINKFMALAVAVAIHKHHVNQLFMPQQANGIKMSYNLWQLQVAGDKYWASLALATEP